MTDRAVTFTVTYYRLNSYLSQRRSQVNNWGGAHIHLFVFTNHNNKQSISKEINMCPPRNYPAGYGSALSCISHKTAMCRGEHEVESLSRFLVIFITS